MSFHLGKPRLPSVEYYPNNIGNLTVGTPRSYAFLIYGRDERGIQAQILAILHKRGARILSQNGYSDERNKEFTLCVSCDLGEVSVTPDDLVIELRRMKLVRNAMAICLKNRMFDGFLFPLTILMTGRVVAVNSNLSFMIQDRLNTEDSKVGLRDVGRDFALGIVKQIRDKMSSGFPEEAIQENIRGYLKAAGWGSFAWEAETSFERVTVIDPPIYSGKAVGNYFLHGIASGLLEAFRRKKFSLVEEVYNPDTRSLTLMLSEKRIEVKRLEAPGEKKIPVNLEVKALEEVEKVIRSVELDEMEIETPVQAIVAKEQPKQVVLVQQTGQEERQEPTPLPPPIKAERLEKKPEEPRGEEITKAPVIEPIKPEIMAEAAPKLEPKPEPRAEPKIEPPVETKKPLIIQVKGIKEKEELEDEDEEDELWFEQAIQEE
ncbi:MAG TPA: hypothetical protein VED17_09110 [Nitrososphaerales archaeon]|nr:hypothetical protein [Nitrososphaerales archaeon]